ncbi:MAG: CFI-box-CTERM domain-containing protein [Armatimonadota bacterium]
MAYGSQHAAEIRTFRAFRDEHLRNKRIGWALIRMYYAISPTIAKWLERHQRAAMFARDALLEPLRKRIQETNGSR